jgi:hypothetical protein
MVHPLMYQANDRLPLGFIFFYHYGLLTNNPQMPASGSVWGIVKERV